MIYSTKTLKMAVIGDPIDHSLSPFMHGAVIEEHGYDALYIPVHVAPDETRRFAEAAAYLGFAGFNATMPHKVSLLGIVDEVDEAAAKYGAINTVRIRDGRMAGYNTDADGLMAALDRRDAEISGANIMVIGAGGAAGALIHAFSDRGAASVNVINRTVEKAEKAVDGIRGASALAMTQENMAESAAGADIIVNCTPLGMTGVKGRFSDLSFLDDTRALVCDLIYNPWRTELLKYAEDRGLRTMNGMDMLIYQGLLSFQIFTDIELDLNAEYEFLYPLCEKRLNG